MVFLDFKKKKLLRCPTMCLVIVSNLNISFSKINVRKIVVVLPCDSQFLKFSLQDERWSKTFDPKLQKLLSELEAGLSTVLRRSDPNYTGAKFSEDDVRGVFCSYVFHC